MKTILLIDDQVIFRELLSQILKAEGYRVLTARNGAEGFAVLSETTPHLILLDIQMPVMDGLTFLRSLRESQSTMQVPVLMLSEVTDKERILTAVGLGVQGYMLKSQFSLKGILERVRAACIRESDTAAAKAG